MEAVELVLDGVALVLELIYAVSVDKALRPILKRLECLSESR